MEVRTNKKDMGGFIAIVAVAIIVLGIVMSVAGPGSRFGSAWSYLTNGQSASQAPATGSSIVGGPSISAQFIDQMLTKYGSPATGTGQDLYNLGVQNNIDPAFALAVFFNESNFGKAGMASSTRSLGNLRCIPSAACWDGYASFSSWQDGYSAFYKLISGPLYVGSGLTTPETIIPRYAPSGDGNSPSHYASVVNSCLSLWRSGSMGVPA
jgi:hypothetical protein